MFKTTQVISIYKVMLTFHTICLAPWTQEEQHHWTPRCRISLKWLVVIQLIQRVLFFMQPRHSLCLQKC